MRCIWKVVDGTPITASWVIKKLCKVKETLREWMESPKYSIDVVYKDHRRTTDKERWANTVWNRVVIPRSRFVVWSPTMKDSKQNTGSKAWEWWMMVYAPSVELNLKRLNTSSSTATSTFNVWKPLKVGWALTGTSGIWKICSENTIYPRKNRVS